MQALPAFKDRYDVVIVGARCAGAATAMLLARSGAQEFAGRPAEVWLRYRLHPRLDAGRCAAATALGPVGQADGRPYAAGSPYCVSLWRR